MLLANSLEIYLASYNEDSLFWPLPYFIKKMLQLSFSDKLTLHYRYYNTNIQYNLENIKKVSSLYRHENSPGSILLIGKKQYKIPEVHFKI